MNAGVIQTRIAVETDAFQQGLTKALGAARAFSSSTIKSFGLSIEKIEEIGKAAGFTEKHIKDLQQRFGEGKLIIQQTRALKAFADTANLTAKEVRQLERAMKLPAGTFASKLREDAKAAQGASSAIAHLKATIAGYLSINMLRDVAKTSVDLASMQKTFYALTGTTEGAKAEISYLRNESQRLGLDFFALTESFKGFSAAGKTAGMSAAQVREIFTSVTEASTVLGLNSDRTKLALYALEQMLSKGAVSMEELRRQLGDQLPGAFQIGAKAMGLTTREFAKLVETGQLASAEFLPKFAAELRKAFGPGLSEAMKTPRAEIQRLMNEITFAKVEIGEGGFLAGLSESAKALRTAMQTDDMKANLQQLGYALGTVTGGVAKLASVALNNSTGILAIGAAFGTANIAAKALIPTLTSVASFVGKIRLAGGVGTAGGLAALGGPAGIATGALAALAGGVAYLSMQQSEGEKYAAKYAESIELIAKGGAMAEGALDKMRNEIRAMSEEMRGLEYAKLEKSIHSISGEMKSLFSEGAGLWEMFMKEAGEALEGPFAKAQGLALYSKEFRDEIAKIGKETGLTEIADKFIDLSQQMEEAVLRQQEFNNDANHTGNIVSIASMSVAAYTEAMHGLAGAMRLVSEYGKDVDSAVGTVLDPAKIKKAFQDADYKEFIAGLSKADKAVAKEMKGFGLNAAQMRQALSGDLSFLAKDVDRERFRELSAKWRKGSEKDKSFGGGSDRTAYQSDKYVSDALAAIEQLRSKHAELKAQLEGSGLDAALHKIEGSYAASFAKIAQDRKKYEADLLIWQKKGKAGGETAENIRQALENLGIQEEQLRANQRLEETLARRNQLEKEYQSLADYSGLVGDLRGVYDAEVKLLGVKLESANIDSEREAIMERIRQATARRDLDVGGMMLTGVLNQSRQAQEDYVKFFEDLPGVASTASKAVGVFAADVGMSTKSIGDAWDDLGKSLQQTIHGMIADLTSLYLRMALFGNFDGKSGSMGGLFGAIAGGIGSFFGGGSSGIDVAMGSESFGLITAWPSAKGNAFAANTGLSSYRNSVVTSPTFFAFARGGVPHRGLMGEKSGSPGEAIMPLVRNSQGDLSVNVTGIAGSSSGEATVNINVINNMGDSSEVSVRQTPSANGGINYDILIEQKVKGMFASGKMNSTMRNNFGLKAVPR